MDKFVDYLKLDQKIAELANSSKLDILFYINPQNLEEEKTKFFEELKSGNIYNPHFRYPSKNPLYSYFSMQPNFEIYKSELRELSKDLGTDCLSLLYENKILDVIESMELVKSTGTPNFSNNSVEYYGSVDKKLLKLAKEQVSKKVKEKKSQKVTLKTAMNRINAFLKKNKLNHKIQLRDSSGALFSVAPPARKIFINKNIQFTEDMLKRFIAHEIETHIYRFENGFNQDYKILSLGTSKIMLETEEGLAVNIEKIMDLEVEKQLKIYAGRVIAVHLASKKSFYETFEELTRFFSDDEAFILTTRAKRGTYKTSEPGAFTKDMLYFRGKFLVEDFLKENGVSDLYYGKYSVTELPLVKGVDGLKKQKYLPSVLKKYL